jgi:hypothetical protein
MSESFLSDKTNHRAATVHDEADPRFYHSALREKRTEGTPATDIRKAKMHWHAQF